MVYPIPFQLRPGSENNIIERADLRRFIHAFMYFFLRDNLLKSIMNIYWPIHGNTVSCTTFTREIYIVIEGLSLFIYFSIFNNSS